mgnify:CR=1 FL=1
MPFRSSAPQRRLDPAGHGSAVDKFGVSLLTADRTRRHRAIERPDPLARPRRSPGRTTLTDLTIRLRETADRLENRLDALLRPQPAFADGSVPAEPVPLRLVEATRHAVLGGGKRFRPFLVIETARLFGRDDEAVVDAAAAFECLHCYSLVHDDLPAMDDDDLRRGRPTVHRAYDEATAILVGDGLLTLAFEILARLGASVDAEARAALVACLASAAGFSGMVGGQFLDLNPALAAEAIDERAIARLQRMKTGALIRASCEAGAIVAGATDADRERLARFGTTVGAAFQLADDLLDVEGTEAQTGKRTGKDDARGKATLAALWGVARARTELARLVATAEAELAPFGEGAALLREAARFVASRTS